MRNKSILLVLIAIVVTVFISGCSFDDIFGKPKVMVTSPFDVKVADVSSNPVTDIYFDASLSMAGYTTVQNNNFYRQLPDDLMAIGSSIGETNFYSFGKNVSQLSGYDYRKFINTEAYVELENSIKDVVSFADSEHLTVIVTDLFETDAAWSAISSKLQERYFTKKHSVAVLGFKSPFNGIIYDVGLDFAKLPYDSGTDANKYRPVYMLVMGPDDYVNDFIKCCQDKQVGNSSLRYVKLSNSLLAGKPADIASMDEEDFHNVVPVDDNLLFSDKDCVAEYKIDNLQEEVEIVRSFKYIPDQYGCKLDFSKIQPKVQVKYVEQAEPEDGEPKAEDENVDLVWKDFNGKNISVTVVKNEEKSDTYDVHVKFNPTDALNEGTINGMLIQLVPEVDGLVLPDWVNQWNIPGYIASDITAFDGSKTVNLQKTVDTLKNSVLKYGNPTLINMELYFDLH